ncbi:hypothetical protein MAR_014338 [Mya arenaria]|uniref:Uncharacterized protein n=1 Tax=Mya arenaria TaxID=6604 RepID=A0ABY7G558_MYAAR|nr:hypothetical protein MAR_014338 [Mya arenaria]
MRPAVRGQVVVHLVLNRSPPIHGDSLTATEPYASATSRIAFFTFFPLIFRALACFLRSALLFNIRGFFFKLLMLLFQLVKFRQFTFSFLRLKNIGSMATEVALVDDRK